MSSKQGVKFHCIQFMPMHLSNILLISSLPCYDPDSVITFFTCLMFAYIPPDIDECVANSTICGLNSICVNLAGSFNCSCKKGYTLVHDKCVGM